MEALDYFVDSRYWFLHGGIYSNGTSRISLYIFWKVTCIFYATFSTSSFSFKDFSTLSLASLFSFIAPFTFSSTYIFSCRVVAYYCCILSLSSITLVDYILVNFVHSLISCIIPTCMRFLVHV
jgi:hypothetical protein